jgi:hypothetical protein
MHRPLELCRKSYTVFIDQGKGTFHPRTGHEASDGEYRYSSTLSLISALDEVGGRRHGPAVLPSGNRPVTILEEAGWAPGPVWTGAEISPYRDSIPAPFRP